MHTPCQSSGANPTAANKLPDCPVLLRKTHTPEPPARGGTIRAGVGMIAWRREGVNRGGIGPLDRCLASTNICGGWRSTVYNPEVMSEQGSNLFDGQTWHRLRAKASSGPLTRAECQHLSALSAQVAIFDEREAEHQTAAIKPVLQRHEEVLKSLGNVAEILRRAMEAIERSAQEGCGRNSGE